MLLTRISVVRNLVLTTAMIFATKYWKISRKLISLGRGLLSYWRKVSWCDTHTAQNKSTAESTSIIVHPKFHHQLKIKPETTRLKLTFPQDCYPLLLSYLAARELDTASLVCKRWFILCKADRLWFSHCLKDFDLKPTSCREFCSKRICARTLYIHIFTSRTKTFLDSKNILAFSQ